MKRTPHELDGAAQRRRLAARIGGLALHARYDSREITGPARKGFLEKFLAQVDPEGVLPAEERQRRAQFALKAHMARLALASAEARRKK